MFQDTIESFADDLSDPITLTLESLAEDVKDAALADVKDVLRGGGPPSLDLTITTGKDTRGLFFRIEFDYLNSGRISRYLAAKERREHRFLEAALIEVVGIGGLRTQEGRLSRNLSTSGIFPRGAGFTI